MTTDGPALLVHLSDTDLTPASDADDIRGRTVMDRNGDDIGSVDDLLIDPDERRVRFLQVGSGGFLGLGEQKVLILVDAVEEIRRNGRRRSRGRRRSTTEPSAAGRGAHLIGDGPEPWRTPAARPC